VITQLNIKGLAIIENLEIDFSPGFNVITGETGAGKSILILALHFLTGAKVSADVVRSGAGHALVSGEFLIQETHPAVLALQNLGIAIDLEGEDAVVLIRRQLSSKGRSQAWINDVAVSSQALKEIGHGLVDIFAQHENQRLMHPGEHVRYLDQFSNNSKEVKAVQFAFAQCESTLNEIESLVKKVTTSERDRDYLEFRLGELEKFKPSSEDFRSVNELSESVDKVVAEREVLKEALALLDSGDSQGVSQLLWELAKKLGQLGEFGEPLKERAETAAREIEDIHFSLSGKIGSFEVDESDLEEAQHRQFGYQELFRKHSVKNIEELLGVFNRLKNDVGSLESAKEKLQELVKQLKNEVEELKKVSVHLSETRKRNSLALKKKVEREIHELSMPGARLDFDWSPVERVAPPLSLASIDRGLQTDFQKTLAEMSSFSALGSEKVQFLLASNPGEASLPLVKSASGGELSRIMLALKKTLAADAETCVLVFDEIDTGISGSVADVVGRKMRELAAHFQVICISHLPQVAVYADTHCLVKKAGKKNRTETEIVKLSLEESAKEIARLMSGREVTPSSLNHAKNLMAQARNTV
jgi:DNA repair protein RecN (Recombination protein N)